MEAKEIKIEAESIWLNKRNGGTLSYNEDIILSLYHKGKSQSKQIEDLQKKVKELKGEETSSSTHRCSYCENFYANEENPLDDYDDGHICKDCLPDIAKDRIGELESDLEEVTKLKERVKESKEEILLKFLKWMYDDEGEFTNGDKKMVETFLQSTNQNLTK